MRTEPPPQPGDAETPAGETFAHGHRVSTKTAPWSPVALEEPATPAEALDRTRVSGRPPVVDSFENTRISGRPVAPDPAPAPAPESSDSGFHLPQLRETIARGTTRPLALDRTAASDSRASDSRAGDSLAGEIDDVGLQETLASASATLRGPIQVTAISAGAALPGAALAALPGPGDDGIPRRIGRFPILRRLGSGGMGTVYAGFDEELARRVAIKVLHIAGSYPRERREMLVSEAQAMARLSHPNVVQIYELGEHAGGIFLVMEYIEGPTLDLWLEAAGRPWESILAMFIAAGEGLAAAHRAGIVHRDFKPDNVLIADGEVPKVADFGLARPSAEGIAQIAGTPAFMSPEQHLGEPVGVQSDIFSFCVALYGALFDVAPFAGETLPALRESVTGGELRPAPARSPVPARVRAALTRGLLRAPEARQPSMDALLIELRAGLPRGASPWFARIGLVLAGATAAALAVVTLLRAPGPAPAEVAAVTAAAVLAQASAAKAEWVYPIDDPRRTAIRRIVALEALEGPIAAFARREAGELRGRFGGELARLGDHYWEDLRTRPFARDFYAQVLIFLPDHEVALRRANFSPGQLADLRDQALAGGFTPEQLAAVLPLRVLADLDDPDLASKIAALARRCEGPLVEAGALAAADGSSASSSSASPFGRADAAANPPEAAPEEAAPEEAAPEEAAEEALPSTATPTPSDPAAPAVDAAPAPRLPRPSTTSAAALIAQAENARRLGRDAEAAALFQQALALSPRDATSLAALSDIAFDRGDYREAARLAQRAIKLAPTIAEHYTRLGDAHYKLGKNTDARAAFEQAIALGDGRAQRRLDLLKGAGP